MIIDKKWERLYERYELNCQRISKATLIKLSESPADKQKRIKRLEKDYIAWFEYYFPHYAKCKCAWYHRIMANTIIKNKRIKFLAEIFRSGAKSVHVDMGIPLFLMVTGALHFMLLIGLNELKSKQLISDIQAELQYNQRFINDYGVKLKKGDWSDGNFYTVDGVRFMALGFGQPTRGLREGANRPDYIAVDDVDTKKHINNKKLMGEYVDVIMEEIMGCFDESDEATQRFVFANNNFHKNSITNLLKLEFLNNAAIDKQEGIKSDYTVLTVPAVKSLVTFEPNWKEKTTAEYWRRKYRKNSRRFLREYQHVHVQEGKFFKQELMQWRKMLPLHEYDALCVRGDLSYKDQGDFKGLGLVGKRGRSFDIIHFFLRQTSRREAAVWLYDLYEDKKLDRYNISYKIDGLFAQDEFVNDFDTEGDERGYYIPVVADKKPMANKFDRIESDLGHFERRRVWFNEDEKTSTDQIELVDQYLSFEKGSQAHDDGPDLVHSAFDDLNRADFVEKFVPRITKRTNIETTKYRF